MRLKTASSNLKFNGKNNQSILNNSYPKITEDILMRAVIQQYAKIALRKIKGMEVNEKMVNLLAAGLIQAEQKKFDIEIAKDVIKSDSNIFPILIDLNKDVLNLFQKKVSLSV